MLKICNETDLQKKDVYVHDQVNLTQVNLLESYKRDYKKYVFLNVVNFAGS